MKYDAENIRHALEIPVDVPPQGETPASEQIVKYYTRAGEDYAAWSAGLNMHFGLWRKGLNPLKLEPMLEAMNQLVLESLGLSGEQESKVADLGCGTGATLRHLAAVCPHWTLHGTPWFPTGFGPA